MLNKRFFKTKEEAEITFECGHKDANKIELEKRQLDFNAGMQFLHLRNRGYLVVEIDREKTAGKWHLIDDVKTENYKVWLEQTLVLEGSKKDGLI